MWWIILILIGIVALIYLAFCFYFLGVFNKKMEDY